MEWSRGIAAGVVGGCAALFGPPALAQNIGIDVSVVESSPLDSEDSRTFEGVSLEIDLGGIGVMLNPSGKPKLGLTFSRWTASSRWQFIDCYFDDPGGPTAPLLCATLEAVVGKIDVGETLTLSLTDGAGDSGQSPLATDYGSFIEIDTGAALFRLPKDGSLLGDCWVGNTKVFSADQNSGFYVIGDDGLSYSSMWGVSETTLIRNGPASSTVEVNGTLKDPQGNALADFQMELKTYFGQQSLQGRVTMLPLAGSSTLQVAAAHLLFQSSDDGSILDASSQLRAVLNDPAYLVEVPNVSGSGSAFLPPPQSISVQRAQSTAGFTAVTRWEVPDWPQIVAPGGQSWISLQMWPRELAIPQGGGAAQWSGNQPTGRFVEFTLGVHEVVPTDLQRHGRIAMSPLIATEIVP